MLLTHEHEEIRRTVERWAETEVNPHMDEREAAGIFPAHQVFKSLGGLGILGVDKPEAYGGLGLDVSYLGVVAEAISKVKSGGVPMAVGAQMAMATPALAEHGTKELCEEFLAPAITGEMVAAIAVSEPGAGSDVAGLRTSARKDGDDYVINGSKMWITNGTQADYCCLLANTDDGPAHKNKSLIIVPMNTPGVSVANKIDKIGMKSSDTAELFFDDVRVPQRHLIGEENMGFIYQMQQFQVERLWVALSVVGLLQRAIDCTLDYIQDRKAFGKPLASNQWIGYRMAEMQAELDALRALSWQAVEQVLNGQDATRMATAAKLMAGKASRNIADGCLQFWGGMGYATESEISRIYCDARLTPIAGGADEVMMQILTKYMGIHAQ